MRSMGLAERLFGSRGVEERSLGPTFSISDPALAEYLGISSASGIRGVTVTENNALGVSAFYRCVALISGTIAGLPLKTFRDLGEDRRERVDSWTDEPAGPYPLTQFEWVRLAIAHMVTRGECFLLHVYNAAGQLIGAWPIHPGSVEVKWNGSDKKFKVNLSDGTKREYTTAEMTHVMFMSQDGLRGTSPLTLFRLGIGLAIAGDTAAGRTFGNGALIAGLVTPEEDMEEEDAKVIKAGLSAKLTGIENAGDIAVVNRRLKFTPWSMTNEDAQFLESRIFQVEEFARFFGVPPHLLGQVEKQTSWGTGVAEQNLGLARYTLMAYTTPFQQALSTLQPVGQFNEFDYAGLLQGTPQQEIELLIKQIDSGLLTVDEARAIRNLPPLTAKQKAELKPVTEPTPLRESA